MSCYHGIDAGHKYPCRPEPIHIKPFGESRVICDSPNRYRMNAPAFVSTLMGATCKRCRYRFERRSAVRKESTAAKLLRWFVEHPGIINAATVGDLSVAIGAHPGTAVYQRMNCDLIQRHGLSILRTTEKVNGKVHHKYHLPLGAREHARFVLDSISQATAAPSPSDITAQYLWDVLPVLDELQKRAESRAASPSTASLTSETEAPGDPVAVAGSFTAPISKGLRNPYGF